MIKTKKDTVISNKVIFITVGLALIVLSFFAIAFFRGLIADIVLPDIAKKYLAFHELQTDDGIVIPATTQLITNNGKLYAFCNGVSSVLVAILFYCIGVRVYKCFFDRHVRIDLSKTMRLLEVAVAILAIFTFTSKVNTDTNIAKYEIKFESGSYKDPTENYDGQGLELIGFFKKADFETDKVLIPVYMSPTMESTLVEENDKLGQFNISLIRNVGTFSNYSEMMTIALAVVLLVLSNYQKRVEDFKSKK